MKLGTLAYVPPPAFGCAQSFYENLTQFTTRYDLLLFSDHNWPGVITVRNPEINRGAVTDANRANKFAINNLIFLTGLRIALKLGYSHIIYLESDCRVCGDHWDAWIFHEAFMCGRPFIAAGTLAVYNPSNHSGEANLRWLELCARNWRRNVPVATYGWLAADKKENTCVFPNGALAVMDMAWMKELFDLENTIHNARQIAPWDMQMGLAVSSRWGGVLPFDLMVYLESVYSGYGDILTSPEERKDWLVRGKVVGVHQIKDQWKP